MGAERRVLQARPEANTPTGIGGKLKKKSREIFFSQSVHFNSFSPLCVSLCRVKCPFWENLFSQNSLLNGFSPVCLRSCPVKCPFWKILSFKIYMQMMSLQFMYAHVQLNVFLAKKITFEWLLYSMCALMLS